MFGSVITFFPWENKFMAISKEWKEVMKERLCEWFIEERLTENIEIVWNEHVMLVHTSVRLYDSICYGSTLDVSCWDNVTDLYMYMGIDTTTPSQRV